MGRRQNLLLTPKQDPNRSACSSEQAFFMACPPRKALIQQALIETARQVNHCQQPWTSVDGCTTTPATQALSASKRALKAWMLGESQAEATQRNTRGSAWKPDLAQTCDPPGANSALYCAKPNDNRARAAPHDQTGGNRVQSPESCTDRLGWHAPLHAPVMPEHQKAGQEQVSR